MPPVTLGAATTGTLGYALGYTLGYTLSYMLDYTLPWTIWDVCWAIYNTLPPHHHPNHPNHPTHLPQPSTRRYYWSSTSCGTGEQSYYAVYGNGSHGRCADKDDVTDRDDANVSYQGACCADEADGCEWAADRGAYFYCPTPASR